MGVGDQGERGEGGYQQVLPIVVTAREAGHLLNLGTMDEVVGAIGGNCAISTTPLLRFSRVFHIFKPKAPLFPFLSPRAPVIVITRLPQSPRSVETQTLVRQ